MTDNLNNSRRSGSALNIGIGMLIGLAVALIVAAFAMSGGPFREKANTNTLTPTTGSTDPNAPLYTTPTTQMPAPPSSDPAANEQGTGTGALMSGQAPTSSKKPSDTTTDTTAFDNPVTKPKKSDDPIGDLISNKVAPTTDKTKSVSDSGKSGSKTDADSNTPAPKTAPKTTKPTPAPSDSPKTVNPVTAPTTSNGTSNRYTIQAGTFSDEQAALNLKKQLATQGQLAAVTKKQTSDGTIYRVRVGNYTSSKDAQAANQKIKGVVLATP